MLKPTKYQVQSYMFGKWHPIEPGGNWLWVERWVIDGLIGFSSRIVKRSTGEVMHYNQRAIDTGDALKP